MIRLILADDHAIVRSGLAQIFALTPDIVVVGEAAHSREVLEQWRRVPCDMLLLDLSMPEAGGVDLIKRLRDEKPAVPILVLSMHNEAQVVMRALKAGAAGYVTKDSKPDILLAAIRKVAAGGQFLDPALVESVVFKTPDPDTLPHEALSRREIQVLERIAAGEPLGNIAQRLNLSPKTISTHKLRLMRKLAITNNVELIRYAIRHGMVAT